jgi:hypothetical protein
MLQCLAEQVSITLFLWTGIRDSGFGISLLVGFLGYLTILNVFDRFFRIYAYHFFRSMISFNSVIHVRFVHAMWFFCFFLSDLFEAISNMTAS